MIEMDTVKCSIIVPVFCNYGSLKKTYEAIVVNVIEQMSNTDFEFIFIDDGSLDDSFQELLELSKTATYTVKILKFSRNFGQVPAIYAGYAKATGDVIVNISADLQDPPELIIQMIDAYRNDNFDIVICAREARDEGIFRRLTSAVFYALIRKLSFKNMPQGGFDYVLISKKVKNILLSNKDTNPFWQGQILWTGFQPKIIYYERQKRTIGKSKWTFSKKLKYLFDGVLAYSFYPLRLMSITGLVFFIAGILYGIIIVILYLQGTTPFKGWSPIMILILLSSGLQMLISGVIGEYLWRTLDQARNRPLYVIEQVIEPNESYSS